MYLALKIGSIFGQFAYNFYSTSAVKVVIGDPVSTLKITFIEMLQDLEAKLRGKLINARLLGPYIIPLY